MANLDLIEREGIYGQVLARESAFRSTLNRVLNVVAYLPKDAWAAEPVQQFDCVFPRSAPYWIPKPYINSLQAAVEIQIVRTLFTLVRSCWRRWVMLNEGMQTIIVQTAQGAVRGRMDEGVGAFLGIPYAAPLNGIRRFQAPQQPQPWDGTRDAIAFSAAPPQAAMPPIPPLWHPADDADCLTVNVWTPDPGASGLPVMVWFYGGAFIFGAASQPEFDGANLARAGVVMVSLNYRTGFEGLGWLPDAPQNRALLDQLAALRWVQENIARFGGDPGNVTIFGQSAGASAVAALTAAEAGRGLFRRAIGQSVTAAFLPEERARGTAERIAGALGVPLTSEAFADLAPEAIHAVQSTPGEVTPYGPVIDGNLVRDQPWRGLRAEVDLMTGFARDEYRFFAMAMNEDLSAVDVAGVAAAHAVPLDAYRAAYPGASDADLYLLIQSDAFFRIPSMWCAQEHRGRSWCYELTWPTPVFGGALGACHLLDVPLMFGNFRGPMAAMLFGDSVPREALELAQEFSKSLTDFASTGNPGWPEYRKGEALTRIWDVPGSVAADPVSASREIWEQKV
ncbi:carboxylesterase family protein [Amycolatopsis sp. NPDC005232]|uniref:carboxylesterase/lipase family protein n=1 Tax=Amycolatopsis sp. NPDC005232 TaxID=3157027 RepID=UPI0033A47266